MEDLNKLLELTDTYPAQLEQMTENFFMNLRGILWGQVDVTQSKEKIKEVPLMSPQHTKKRVKRLSSLNEDNEVEDILVIISPVNKNSKKSPQRSNRSNSELFALVDIIDDDKAIENESPNGVLFASSNMEKEGDPPQDFLRKSEATNLMPPPPLPLVASADETLNKRPKRAAKIKSEKNLKEQPLKTKLRRPTIEEVKIKLEHEQRQSQMHEATINTNTSKHSNNGTIVLTNCDTNVPTKKAKEKKKSVESTDSGIREIRIKIKREKVSSDNQEDISVAPSDEAVFKAPEALPLSIPLATNETTAVEETMASSMLSTTTNSTNVATAKKIRKKGNVVHKPIKVERFSDLDPKASPISSRTRHGSLSKTDNNNTSLTKDNKRPASIYEDAVETPPPNNSNKNAIATGIVANETVNLGPSPDGTMNLGPISSNATFYTDPAQTTFEVVPGQTTFVMDSNPNATVTLTKHSGAALADVTFDIIQDSKLTKDKEDDAVAQRSFATSKYSSMPNEDGQENLIVPKSKVVPALEEGSTKTYDSAKAACKKMSTRTNELLNPVKMRVEAIEIATAAATEQSKRTLRSKKENVTPTTTTTPVIGKLSSAALGRFLTPTLRSNITTVNSAIAKKGTTSASKLLSMPKSANVSSLIRSNSTASTRTLQNERSADDFRKGLQSLAEERKKQREQKHLLAAQQREAKERERAERAAKLAKEREEKRTLKKQLEQEQKKRELEEIQRKLRQQQEEAVKLKAAKEREILLQMKKQELANQKMMPPPPKTASKYTFEMLHEDDSTDDEDKVSYKRPPPPSWSRKHVRGPIMLKQEYAPSAYIDSFFSVQPMTPDLKMIFPNIDARHLKRNSSVLWSTPPRYSELPKY